MSVTRYGSLKGRTVIITGGASGIGASLVRAFVENGAKIAFRDLQREAGAALSDPLVGGAARPLFVPCDLTDTATLRAALGEIRAALGPAAVLVNNAANDQRYEFDQIIPEQFDRTIAINFAMCFSRRKQSCRRCVSWATARSSIYRRCRGCAASRCSKPMPRPRRRSSASPIRSPARWAAPHPGQRDRARHRAHRAPAPAVVQTEAQVEAARAAQCLPDLIAPDDIANLVLFLASDDSRLITKQTISVNAGVL